MSHRAMMCYIRTCDGCGAAYNDGAYEYVPHWPSLEEMLKETPDIDSEWQEIDGKHFCPRCYDWDAETGDVIRKPSPHGGAS